MGHFNNYKYFLEILNLIILYIYFLIRLSYSTSVNFDNKKNSVCYNVKNPFQKIETDLVDHFNK